MCWYQKSADEADEYWQGRWPRMIRPEPIGVPKDKADEERSNMVLTTKISMTAYRSDWYAKTGQTGQGHFVKM